MTYDIFIIYYIILYYIILYHIILIFIQSESSNNAFYILTYLSFFAFGFAYLILLITGLGISVFGSGAAVSTTTLAVTFLGIISSSESSNKFLMFF